MDVRTRTVYYIDVHDMTAKEAMKIVKKFIAELRERDV